MVPSNSGANCMCIVIDKTPLGGILKDKRHCWLALGPKFCVVDLRTGLKVAARTFGVGLRYFVMA